MNLLIVGNPVAGGGSASQKIEELRTLLERGGHRAEFFLTRARGDARERVRTLPESVEAVVVVGGDGTLNEVVNGVDLAARRPLAFVPAGTGNVIAHELGLTRATPAVIAGAIDRGERRWLDLGVVNERRFVMLASVGFDALVTQEVMKIRRGTFGVTGYLLPVLRAVRRYRPPRLLVRVDDGPPLEGTMVILNKTPHYGGILTIAPEARCDSGRFDVCIFGRGSVPWLCRYFVAALRGRLRRVRRVTWVTGTRVAIEADVPYPVQVDGDFIGTTPITVQLLPGVLPMFVPGKAPAAK